MTQEEATKETIKTYNAISDELDNVLDSQIIDYFKKFQKETGQYKDLDIDKVEFEKVYFKDKNFFEINPKKGELDKELIDKNIEVSFIPMASVNENLGIIKHQEIKNIKDVNSGSYRYFKDNDVIFAKVTPCMENGNCFIAKDLKNSIGFGSSEFIIFRSEKIHSKILWLFLRQKSFREQAQKSMSGSGGLKRVPISFFNYIFIKIPKSTKNYNSYQIQEAIIEFLEFNKAKSDKFRNKMKNIEDYKEDINNKLLPNTFNQNDDYIKKMFIKWNTDPIEPRNKEDMVDFNLDDVIFEEKELKYIAEKIQSGGTPSTKKNEYWVEDSNLVDNIDFFAWRNIEKKLFENMYLEKYSKVITKEAYNNSSTWLIPPNSLLLAIASNSKGLLTINTESMCINQNILGITFNDNEYDVKYMYFNLKMYYSKIVEKSFGNFTKGSESARIIKIPKPITIKNKNYSSYEVQEAIVSFIERFYRWKKRLEGLMKQADDLLDTIDELFLYKTFGG